MNDEVLIDGDKIVLPPPVGLATLTPGQPLVLRGSAKKLFVGGKKVCVVKDLTDLTDKLTGIKYTTATFTVAGSGTLSITLNSDQQSRKLKDGLNSVLLKGTTFTVTFKVTVRAAASNGSKDPTPTYTGSGQFFITGERKAHSA